VLILSRDRAIGVMERLLAAPVTTTVRGLPTEVPLGLRDGLPVACVVSLDDMAPLAKDYLVERITTLSVDRMAEVARALRRATGC
jgi:mRNA interferase MazF